MSARILMGCGVSRRLQSKATRGGGAGGAVGEAAEAVLQRSTRACGVGCRMHSTTGAGEYM